MDGAGERTYFARVKAQATELLEQVPVYAGRAKSAPPSGDQPGEVAAWLATIAPVAKRDLRRAFPKGLTRRGQDLNGAMQRGEVELIATSGTTEDRLQVIWDQAWWTAQERDAMRLNAEVARAMDDGYREAVLTTPVCGGATCHIGNLSRAERTLDGILFLNQIADPTHWSDRELDRMVDEWVDFQPRGVEADPAYLAQLARHAARRGVKLAARFVDLTYELTTRAQRRAIARAVEAPIYQLYGATEAGVLLMECERGLLHANAEHVHVELQPVGERLAKVYVTTLDRTWMPLLRYDTNDLVRTREAGAAACGCGRPFALAERVEGRAHDAIEVGGRPVTAAALDDAVDRDGVLAWQLQIAPSGDELLVTLDDGVPAQVADDAAGAAAALLGRPVRPRAGAVAPEGSGKYRQLKKVDW